MKTNIKKKFINLLVYEINKFYKNKQDKRGINKIKRSNKKIITIIIDKFIMGITWRDTINIKSNNDNISFSTLYAKYKMICKNNLLESAYSRLLNKYHIKINNKCAFIDTTAILNKGGFNAGYNKYIINKHKSCKASIICSYNGVPLGITVANSTIHDIKLLIDTLPKKITFNNLVGDLGYLANKTFKKQLMTRYNINLITPYRENQNKQNTPAEIQLLKKRFIIENLNSFIKQNKQIQSRYIKKDNTFINYIYMSFIKRALEIFLV